MSGLFSESYQRLVASGAIERDAAQERAARAFAALEERVASHRLARKSSALGWLFGRMEKKQPPMRGLYLYGEVGRGKTMLMDLFFSSTPVMQKRRAHFHEFMADVHERVHGFRQKIASGEIPDADPVRMTAGAIFEESWLLCFDEFHVTDIADAMILGRLFSRLFELGTVLVATSNVAPDDLYKGGLNRALFLPFIAQIKSHMEIMRLDARTDYRLEKLAGLKVWHVPADALAGAALDDVWHSITAGAQEMSREFLVKGHPVRVPRAAGGAARFTFEELCHAPLGAEDYLRLAHEFHTIVIDHVPVLGAAHRNPIKRFIILIDTLYDNGVKLVASAAAPPTEICDMTDVHHAMEFQRTVSRLIEMGSESYLALPHGRSDSSASGSSEGLVET